MGIGVEGSTEEREAWGGALHRRKAWGGGRQTDGAEGWLGGADGNRTERGPRSEPLCVFRVRRGSQGEERTDGAMIIA